MTDNSLVIPQHNQEAEQAVLGSLMLDNDKWHDVQEHIQADDFYFHDNRLLFAAMQTLVSTSQPLDPVTLSEHLHNKNLLAEVGGMPYLSALLNRTPTAANAVPYAKVVADKSKRRQLQQASMAINALATTSESADEAHNNSLKLLNEIADKESTQGLVKIEETLTEWVEELDRRYHSSDELLGLSTGLVDLDKAINGLQPGLLYTIAGRPSMGKSVLGEQLAVHCSVNDGKTVCLVSLEMPVSQLNERAAAMLSTLHLNTMQNPKRMEDEDWRKLTLAISRLKDSPLYFDDSSHLRVEQIIARARRLQRDKSLDLLIIDYLQLIVMSGENRVTAIGEVTRQLKRVAKEMHIPVVILSQLNRGLEQRKDKRPVMSDLRESGDIEQDCDVVIMLYRDEAYDPGTANQGIAEIIIRKQRQGQLTTVPVVFQGEYSRFCDLAGGFYDQGENRPIQQRYSKGFA